jgi:hypothetical protein
MFLDPGWKQKYGNLLFLEKTFYSKNAIFLFDILNFKLLILNPQRTALRCIVIIFHLEPLDPDPDSLPAIRGSGFPTRTAAGTNECNSLH